MKNLIPCLIMAVIAGTGLAAQEAGEEGDGLMDLLRSLEADKEVVLKYGREDAPDGKTTADLPPAAAPLEMLADASAGMKNVVNLLDDPGASRADVVKEQERIISLLDRVLALAGRRGGGGGGGGGGDGGGGSSGGGTAVVPLAPPSGGGGGDDSGGTPPDSLPRNAGSDTTEQWGNLPDRMREEIMQILQEDIPILYRDLLRLYFINLDRE